MKQKEAITKVLYYTILFTLTGIFILMLEHNNQAINTLILK